VSDGHRLDAMKGHDMTFKRQSSKRSRIKRKLAGSPS